MNQKYSYSFHFFSGLDLQLLKFQLKNTCAYTSCKLAGKRINSNRPNPSPAWHGINLNLEPPSKYLISLSFFYELNNLSDLVYCIPTM